MIELLRELWGFFVLVIVLMCLMACVFWWSAGQESQAYYRATGKQVSQWDALFLELRVQNN